MKRPERQQVESAIAWRTQAEVRMAVAREVLDDLAEGMPISLERVQVRAARDALIRAQITCADAIDEGLRAIGAVNS